MFKVGDKVSMKTNMNRSFEGYIVKIEIDPGYEEYVKEVSVFYTVRVFRDFYTDGYADFTRMENELMKEEEYTFEEK